MSGNDPFQPVIELFTDDYSRDLSTRRAEALGRLAKTFSEGFFVHDFSSLREVLEVALRRLDGGQETTIAPGLIALLGSFARPYKRTRAAEERLPGHSEALSGILKCIAELLSFTHVEGVCDAAVETLVAFASGGGEGGGSVAAVEGIEEDVSTNAFHHKLMRESGALEAAVLAFTSQFQNWVTSVMAVANGTNLNDKGPAGKRQSEAIVVPPEAVRVAALSGAKSPELLLTFGRLMLVASEVPDNVDTMIRTGAVEIAIEALSFFAQPQHNLHDASLGIAVELLWNLCEHCFISVLKGAANARYAAPSVAKLQNKHRDLNAMRRVLVNAQPVALTVLHALLGRLVREGHTQADRELRNDLLCVLSVLARASYAPVPFLQSGLCSTLILLSCAAENSLDVGCPLSNFAAATPTDKELKKLCWHTLVELAKTVMTQAAPPAPADLDIPADEDENREEQQPLHFGGGTASGQRRSARSLSRGSSRSNSRSPTRSRSNSPTKNSLVAAAKPAAPKEDPAFSPSNVLALYQQLFLSGPLLPTLLLYLDVREREHRYTSIWPASARKELELLALRLLHTVVPMVSARFLQLEGPAVLLLYMRAHSGGVLVPSFKSQMIGAAVDLANAATASIAAAATASPPPALASAGLSPHASPSRPSNSNNNNNKAGKQQKGQQGGGSNISTSSTLAGYIGALSVATMQDIAANAAAAANSLAGGATNTATGGNIVDEDALPYGSVDGERVNGAARVLSRLCRMASPAGSPISLPLMNAPALWRLIHSRPRLPFIPVQGGGTFGVFMDQCTSNDSTLAIARTLADRDFSLIEAFVSRSCPPLPFSSDDPRFGGSGCPRAVGAAGGASVLVPYTGSSDLDVDLATALQSVRQLGDLGCVKDVVALLRTTTDPFSALVTGGGGPMAVAGSTVVNQQQQQQQQQDEAGKMAMMMAMTDPQQQQQQQQQLLMQGGGAGTEVMMDFAGGGASTVFGASAGGSTAGFGSTTAAAAAGSSESQVAALQESLCLLLAALFIEDSDATAHARARMALETPPPAPAQPAAASSSTQGSPKASGKGGSNKPSSHTISSPTSSSSSQPFALANLQPSHSSPDLSGYTAGAAPQDGLTALVTPFRNNRLRGIAAGVVPVLIAVLRKSVSAARAGNLAEASADESRPRTALAAVCALRASVSGLPDGEAQLVIGGGIDTLFDLLEVGPRVLLPPIISCLAETCGGKEAIACVRAWRGEVCGLSARDFLLKLWLGEEQRLGIKRDPGTGNIIIVGRYPNVAAAASAPLRIMDAGGPPLASEGGPQSPLLRAASSGEGKSAEAFDAEGTGAGQEEDEPSAFKSLRRALRAARMYGGGPGAPDDKGGKGSSSSSSDGGGGTIASHVAAADMRPIIYSALANLDLLSLQPDEIEAAEASRAALEQAEKGRAAISRALKGGADGTSAGGPAGLAPLNLSGIGGGGGGNEGIAPSSSVTSTVSSTAPMQQQGQLPGAPTSSAGVTMAAVLDAARSLPSLMVGTAWDDVAIRLAGLGAGPVEEDARVLINMREALAQTVAAVQRTSGQRADAYAHGISANSARLAAAMAHNDGGNGSGGRRGMMAGGGRTSLLSGGGSTSSSRLLATGGGNRENMSSAASTMSGGSGATGGAGLNAGAHQTMDERKAAHAHRSAMLERSFVGHAPIGADLRVVLQETGVLGNNNGNGSPTAHGGGDSGEETPYGDAAHHHHHQQQQQQQQQQQPEEDEYIGSEM